MRAALIAAAVLASATLRAASVDLTPLRPATMAEMALAPRTASFFAAPNEKRERRMLGAHSSFLSGAAPAETATATPPPAATGFRALTSSVAPADSAGAVSARYCVSVTNDGVVVTDRAGARLSAVSLSQFWSDPTLPNGLVFDPRIVYDAANDRFVVVALYERSAKGRLLIAFTASGDPTGTWNRFSTFFDDAGQRRGDFTNIGQTSGAIVMTVNDFDGLGAYIFVMNKSYGGTPPVQRLPTGQGLDLVPVTTTDATARIAMSIGSTIIVYELSAAGLTNSQAYTATFTFHNESPCGVQLGTTNTLDCGVGDLEAAVQRNGVSWFVQAVSDGVMVWRVSAGGVKGYLIEDAGKAFAYSSIAVNRAGAALVAYSTFSANGYPSAGYSIIDAAGNLSAPALLKSGEGPYTGHFRWGDYTTAVVDPADDSSFWTAQLYSSPKSNEWAIWWGYVKIASQPPTRTRAVRH